MAASKPKVALFITCLTDQFAPHVGECVVKILRRLGVEVTFNPAQTCCGQPAFNTGYREEARAVARRVLDLFEDADYVVAPSGSCTSMVRVFYPELFADDAERLQKCRQLGDRFFEFSEFLVKVLKVEDVGASFSHKVTYHDSCHLLRELGIEEEPRKLIRNVRGIHFVELQDYRLCCGFGGTFAVKFPEVSVAMGEDKLRAVAETRAEYVVANDGGCLMHLAGLIHRQGLPIKTMHLAELLACQE
jgi:L-lactate dehydrogenase complex protein LldE